MNQRLLMIVAIMLLVVGVSGLLLFSDEETPEVQTVSIYTAIRAVKKGEALTPENAARSTKTLTADETAENMPASLDGYVAADAIAEGAVITLSTIALPQAIKIDRQPNHFLYQIALNQEDSLPLSELKKGDPVDIYLRYYIQQDDNMNSHGRNLVDREGKPIVKSMAKVVRLLKNKRFDTLTQGDLSDVLNGKGAARSTLSVELNSEDKSILQRLGHMGELLAYPTHVPVSAASNRVFIPEMITEIRGRKSG